MALWVSEGNTTPLAGRVTSEACAPLIGPLPLASAERVKLRLRLSGSRFRELKSIFFLRITHDFEPSYSSRMVEYWLSDPGIRLLHPLSTGWCM